MRYRQIIEVRRAKEADIKDAVYVASSIFNGTIAYVLSRKVDLKKRIAAMSTAVELPLERINISADHGRRITDEHVDNPIIVMNTPDGGFIVLDGQHRVLTKSERGDRTIKAHVVMMHWVRLDKRTWMAE